ncbi:helix-turn-helix domain-containing protein [Ammoniphilus sp. YIM 78166]|uniref:helix-turn-helix domain-containing protein n=1 Tax=Ammoniphilus sp. YIM 78166 TaxID=1644106 RepID=UPI0014303827|nr:helix-turn-helix domain-containing protein [Ammoniphilus sp. YIM 78166]
MAEFLQDNLRVFVVPVDIMDIPDLDIYEQMVYIVLRSFANAREATAFPSYSTIAKLGRMSRRKAIDCVATLVERGLLKKEIRLDVTKHRKIRNTSNLYTIETPKVVHSMHQGSAQHAPGVVHSMHRGGAQHAPEHNHLTKSLKTKSLNNNNIDQKPKKSVVVDSSNDLEDLLTSYGIKVNTATLNKWRKMENEKTIINAVKETLERPDIKNVVGYINKILETGFIPTQTKIKNDLPDYIINQCKNSQNKVQHTVVDSLKQKEALDLLLQLGEITQIEYEIKLKELI